MSTNITKHQRKKELITQINDLVSQTRKDATLQKQGVSATRLGVIEGYFTVDLGSFVEENARFIEYEAPDANTILIGSLVHAQYWESYNPMGGGTANFSSLDTSNTLSNAVKVTTWMPYSLATDDPNYTTPFTLADVADVALPEHRVRVGCHVHLTLGSWQSDPIMVVVMYQLRFTIGWQ